MKTYLAILLLCAPLFGYETEPNQKLPATITYSCGDAVLKDSFLRMFEIWNFSTDHLFALEEDTVSLPTISIWLNPSLDAQLAGEAYVLGDKSVIFIRSEGLELDAAMLHEIGHALGLAHSSAPHAVMNPYVKNEATLVQDDVDGVRDIYGLSQKTFDFVLKVKGKGISARSPYGKSDWQFGNVSLAGRVRVRHRLGRGVFDVEMTFKGISVYKTAEIK